ncbi:MAG TPA: HEAT repeat domain-containing protein [Longimicrobiales bacterium]
MRYFTLFAAMLAVTACAGGTAPSVAGPAPAASPGTGAVAGTSPAELQKLLAEETVADGNINAYEFKVGSRFVDQVGEVVEDREAPFAARVHALELIAVREMARLYGPVRSALHDTDPRIRATALATAHTLREAGYRSYTALMREALDDAAPEIQAKALQFVGDEDLAALRRIAASDRPATVLSVANGILRALEERGAPLAPDAAGILARTTETGHTLRFVPTHSWEQWGAAVGRVTVRTADNRTIEIPSDIEVVANVVPVFFSADGSHMVYEAGRHIHVMNLATGATRDAGAGIAPRIRPFADGFLFLRADPTGAVSDRGTSRLSYNVLSAPFTGGAAAETIGSVAVTMKQSERGNYSPARWMAVTETDGTFFLSVDDAVLMRLASPFGDIRN